MGSGQGMGKTSPLADKSQPVTCLKQVDMGLTGWGQGASADT